MANQDLRVRVVHPHSSEGGARQEDRLTADINTIVAQYQRSGTMPAVARSSPLYGDFSEIGDDLQSLTEMFDAAADRFGELPSGVRSAASNDYRTFLSMYDDRDGRQVLLDAGLVIVDAEPTAAPSSPPPTSPAPPSPPAPPAPLVDEID